MKRSIGKRLFIQIMAVFLVFIVLAFSANTVLLKPIYNYVKKKDLLEAMDLINSLDGDYENNLSLISETEEKLSAEIMIFNDEETIYMSAGRFFQGEWINEEFQGPARWSNAPEAPQSQDSVEAPETPEEMSFPRYETSDVMKQFVQRNVEESDHESINETTSITNVTADNGSKYMILETTLDDGMSMIVLSELQSLSEAVRIFNLFLLGTAAISMVIIIVMTYFMSKRFVKPITNMNNVTKKIAELNFNAKCDVNTKDELQELSESINGLSGSLESTIADLKRELENAKRLEELRKRFVSTVSHDLKTPISLMQGYSIGLASDVCEQKEKRDYYAQVIAEEAERLGMLVNELMDLTQLEAGYINMNAVDFELLDFLDEMVQKFQAANPGIDMNLEKTNEELWCSADVRLMERVVGNYLSNAVRHASGKKEIKVSVKVMEDYYDVRVMNTGKHIPEDSLDEIWNSFYRVDDARTRSEGGHGLGLSIVKNIQNAHGMPYGVKNVKGGVEFSFGVKKGARPE